MDHGTKSVNPSRAWESNKNSQSTVTRLFCIQNENVEKKGCVRAMPASLRSAKTVNTETMLWAVMTTHMLLDCNDELLFLLKASLTKSSCNTEVTSIQPSALHWLSHKPLSPRNKLRNFYNWLFVGYPIHEMENIFIFRIVIMCWHLPLMGSSLHCNSKWFIFSDWKDALASVQDVRALMAVVQTLSQCYK